MKYKEVDARRLNSVDVGPVCRTTQQIRRKPDCCAENTGGVDACKAIVVGYHSDFNSLYSSQNKRMPYSVTCRHIGLCQNILQFVNIYSKFNDKILT